MTVEPALTRRTALRATTAASGAGCVLALVGCGPSGPATPSKGNVPAAIPTGGTPHQVAKVADLPVGSTAAGVANGVDVMLFRPDETTVLAYTNICTHAGCKVAPNGVDFKCPCHGSVFNAADGTVESGPAQLPLPRFGAAIDGEWITVSV
ncbi:Rieske (2Fe-2S) protein [Arthrobacter sp. TMN-49]